MHLTINILKLKTTYRIIEPLDADLAHPQVLSVTVSRSPFLAFALVIGLWKW